MTWEVNMDNKNGWKFAKALKDIIHDGKKPDPVPVPPVPVPPVPVPPKPTVSGKVLAGYMPMTWNTPTKISEAAKQGYNIILPSFIAIDGTRASFPHNTFTAYTSGWSKTLSSPGVLQSIKDDVKLAK